MDKTTYPGGKARLYQWLINQIPPHSVFISTHLGNCAIDVPDGAAAAPELAMMSSTSTTSDAGLHQHNQRCTPANLAAAADDPGVIAAPSEVTRYNFINTDCVPWLQSYPFTGAEFVYSDPPYLFHTRKQQAAIYRHEYTVEQHIALLHTLVDLPCAVMISGYDSQIYNRILSGWRTKTIQTTTRGNSLATEVIWMNYLAPEALHDYRYLGDDFRERERIKRKKQRWAERWRTMDRLERQAILAAIQEAAQC